MRNFPVMHTEDVMKQIISEADIVRDIMYRRPTFTFKADEYGKLVDYWFWGRRNPTVDKVIFNEPATIVMWSDGTKTIVKCQDGDTFDKEKGLAIAMCKKLYGNTEFGKLLNRYTKGE